MALADHLTPTGQKLDKLSRVIKTLSDEDRDALKTALHSPEYKNADIVKAMNAIGYHEIDASAVGHFRKTRAKMEAL